MGNKIYKGYHGTGRPVYIDPNKQLIIGGGAYSKLSQQTKDKTPVPKTVKLSAQAEKIKKDIEMTAGCWVMLYKNYDSYGITPEEYFEIAKLAIDLYPNEMHHLCDDKLTANQYYDLCAIMARYGVFQGVICNKLARANPDGVRNPLYKIMFTALIKSVFSPTDDNEDPSSAILSAIRENDRHFSPNEKYALYFALWVLTKPQENGKNISGAYLAGISDKTVEYVKNIIIREIYKSPNSDFVNHLNFVSVLLSENNRMPQIVNMACENIICAIHDAGQKRMNKKHGREYA